MPEISTKPYLLRAIYEWCTDNGLTPHLSVKVTGGVQVPMEYVRKGEIVFNVSFGATSSLKMDNEAITFKARFNGASRDIYIPVANVQAIFASENGQGMVFDPVLEIAEDEIAGQEASALQSVTDSPRSQAEVAETDRPDTSDPEKIPKKPSLKVVK